MILLKNVCTYTSKVGIYLPHMYELHPKASVLDVGHIAHSGMPTLLVVVVIVVVVVVVVVVIAERFQKI